MIMKNLILVGLTVGSLGLTSIKADSLVSGSATIDYDATAWSTIASGYGAPHVLTLGAFFNQAESNARTQAQLQSDPNPGGPVSYLGQIYAMNGATVANLPTRYTQPTTFSYTRGETLATVRTFTFTAHTSPLSRRIVEQSIAQAGTK